jgi:S-adenosylmethionine:tRNA ribosyltransferase-isomerase
VQTDDFDFPFPPELIATEPVPRGTSRLVVVARQDRESDLSCGEWIRSWGSIADLGQWLRPGDALILNDTRVLRARLRGVDAKGRAVQVLLLKPQVDPNQPNVTRWQAMVKPGKHFRVGARIRFSAAGVRSESETGDLMELDCMSAEVESVDAEGLRILRFEVKPEDFAAALERNGEVPLPPYIERAVRSEDAERYQSVFAEHPGSVAAPTASLHFDEALLAGLREQGVETVTVTLHVSAGTFRPVDAAKVEDHKMHAETYTLGAEQAARLNAIRARGGRLIAVGTTAARVLETCCMGPAGVFVAGQGETRLFVLPGYQWKGVDGLLTNFHWPRSTLFMLVSSLLGVDGAKEVYAQAMARGFRLFSYGDAMLIV